MWGIKSGGIFTFSYLLQFFLASYWLERLGAQGTFTFFNPGKNLKNLSLPFSYFLPKEKEDILFDKFFFQTRVGFFVDESDLVRIEEDVLEVSRRFSTYRLQDFFLGSLACGWLPDDDGDEVEGFVA